MCDSALVFGSLGGVPMFNIPSVVYPVEEHYLEDVLQMTRYMVVIEMHQTRARQHYNTN